MCVEGGHCERGGMKKLIDHYFVPLGGEMRAGRALMNLEFTFDLFVCVAILTMHSGKICDSTDAASVYGCLNR